MVLELIGLCMSIVLLLLTLTLWLVLLSFFLIQIAQLVEHVTLNPDPLPNGSGLSFTGECRCHFAYKLLIYFCVFWQNENWVLCRIFLKKRAGTKNGRETDTVKPNIMVNDNNLGKVDNSGSKVVVFYDFLAQSNNNKTVASSISPATSGITDELNEHENEESSSS